MIQHRTESNPVAILAYCALPALFALQGCAADVRSLGEDAEPLPDYSRCVQGPVLGGDVTVENQDQLNALEGCEVIEGQLNVLPFAGADLRPLHALREVGGQLTFSQAAPPGGWRGADAECYISCPADTNAQPYLALFESGWLGSLEGLESLERVGGLRIAGLSAETLEPLRNLRSLTNGGYFSLSYCPNLRTLDGLDNLSGFVDLTLACDNLESMAELALPVQLNSAKITGPALRDMGTWPVRGVANLLDIRNTPIEDVAFLSELQWVGRYLILMGHASLVNLDGLNGLVSAGGLNISGLERLERLPDFVSLEQLDGLAIADNPALRDLGGFQATRTSVASGFSLEPHLANTPDFIEIRSNAALERFVMPFSWRFTRGILFWNNPSLRELDLGRFEAVDYLSIQGNRSLEAATMSRLKTVDFLEVSYNPRFSTSTFDAVKTFRRDMVGNGEGL